MITEARDRIDIRGLTILEPVAKTKFGDPVDYFLDSHWDAIKELSKNDVNFGNGFFAMLQILNPVFFKQINVPTAKLTSIFDNLSARTGGAIYGWEGINLFGSDFKVLDPQRFKSLNLSGEVFDRVSSSLRIELEEWDTHVSPSFHVLNLATVFPQFKRKIDEDSKIAEALEDNLEDSLQSADWNMYVHTAASMRVALPTAFNKYKESIYETLEQKVDMEEYMHSNYNLTRPANLQEQMINAAHLRILIAKDVKITNSGIALKMPEEEPETSPLPVPERRRF